MERAELFRWMGQSRVTGEDGLPLLVYRGEHGPLHVREHVGLHSRLGSLSFGSAAAASVYASSPNDLQSDESAQSPRVIPAYLRIENPLIESPDDPFIDVARLSEVLGVEQARRIALKFSDHIEYTGLWAEDFAPKHPSVRAYIESAPQEELDTLYFNLYPLLDDPAEVQLLKAAGIDGAIYGGSGENALEPEYRVFSADQALPAIEAGWPVRMREQERQVAAQLSTMVSPTSTIKKVRAALARMVGESAVRLGEGLGRLVVTTSREIRAEGYYQMSPAALASFADNAGFQKMLAEQRATMARAIAAIGDVGDCAIVRDKSGADRWQMILRDASEPGKWRTQSFDLKGFSGHMVYPDRDAAIHAAASSGFTVRDDMALDRIQDSPQFQRGLYVTDLIGRVNSGVISYGEGDRLLAEYDECHLVLQSIAATGAQAFVVNGGETMYLLADRILAGTEEAVFLHEIVHRYGMRVLGRDGFEGLVRKVKDWSDSAEGSVERDVHDSASRRARAASGASPSLYDEELFAYAVEEAVTRGVRPRAWAHPESAAAWLDQVASTLRGVIRASMGGEIDLSGAQDLVDLAYAFAQLESPERFERIIGVLTPVEHQELLRLVARDGAPVWFSALEMRVRLQAQAKMPARQWIGWINAQVDSGIKPDEIHWSGVTDWLATMPSDLVVERDQVVEFLASNGVKLNEVLKSSERRGQRATSSRDALLVELTALGYLPEIDPYEGALVGVYRRSDSAAFAYDEDRGVFHLDDDTDEILREDVARVAVEYGRVLETMAEQKSEPEAPQYANWTLTGGDHYRELLLTLPVRRTEADFKNGRFLAWMKARHGLDRSDVLARFEDAVDRWKRDYLAEGVYQSSHWADPNVVAHVRLTDRVDIEGRKVLFVEEIQSDWAQDGRDRGFKLTSWEREALEPGSIEAIQALAGGTAGDMSVLVDDGFGASMVQTLTPANRKGLSPVEPAPFVKATGKWVALAIKRIIKLAVDEGYERIAFVTGEQSVARYRLRSEVNTLLLQRDFDGTTTLIGRFDGDQRLEIPIRSDDELSALLGEQDARRLLEAPQNGYGMQEISIPSMGLGGEGMLAFYDKVLPLVVNDVIKGFGGARVGLVDIDPPHHKYVVSQRGTGYAVLRPIADGVTEEMSLHGDHLDAMRKADELNDAHDGRVWRQPGFVVTPAMREAARMGLPMFSFADPRGVSLRPAEPESEREVRVPIETVFPSDLAEWFGKSCATVDGLPARRPLMVFRGASPGDDDVGGVDPMSGKVMDVFWATSSRMNASYFEDGEIQNLYLRLENPLVIRSVVGSPASMVERAQEAVQQGVASWDGVIFEDIVDGSHPSVVYAVFPEDGSVADRVRIVGRTNYTGHGEPIFTGLQPPCSDPTRFDRGDEIRHDIDWNQHARKVAARTAISQWRADARVVAARDRVSVDVLERQGVIHVESLWVDPHQRGNGDASRTLRALVSAADAYGCMVELEVGHDEAGIGLVDWYRRLGFAWANGYMSRMPNATVVDPMGWSEPATAMPERRRA